MQPSVDIKTVLSQLMERLSNYAASSIEVLPEFLQVEAFSKLSNAIGKVNLGYDRFFMAVCSCHSITSQRVDLFLRYLVISLDLVTYPHLFCSNIILSISCDFLYIYPSIMFFFV